MKGKQASPVQSRSPRKGLDKSGSPSKQSTPNDVNDKKLGGRRKLVYRHGQTSGSPAAGSTVEKSATPGQVSLLDAAKALMKNKLAAKATTTTDSSVEVEIPAVKKVKKGHAKAKVNAVNDVASVPGGKKIIKSLPGEDYIQEVLSETGELLNYRCKLCKVRFTDLKEAHMKGRRHRANLETIGLLPETSSETVSGPSSQEIGETDKKPVKKKIVKKKPPRKPAILDGLSQSNFAEMLRREKRKENFTIYDLQREMRDSCVISDRWCIPAPMWDPHTNHEVLLCYETDVLMDGSVRMKRCLKVLDDFELIVLLDGVDKTHIFREKHPTITSLQDMLDLIRKVTMVKVCSGVKDCEASDFDNINTKVIEKGGSWYSTECNVEVERGCLGNICKKCTSLRNTLRRRQRRQYGLDSTPAQNRSLLSTTMKPVLRTVGEALYLNLQHMSGSNRADAGDEDIPLPARGEQVLHPELGIYMNVDLKERLEEVAANPPPPVTKVETIIEYDPRTNTKTLKRVHVPVPLSALRTSRLSQAKKPKPEQSLGNGEVTLVQTANGETIQIPEGYMLADDMGDGNIVIQKIEDAQGGNGQFVIGDDNNIIQVGNLSGNFTLEDGEEYEVIGEAPSGISGGDGLEVLPLAADSNIEIIEVDENMIQLVDDNSQPEITPVDPNSDIFKFLQAHSRLSGL